MNSQVKLHTNSALCKPVGPSFKKPKTWELNIDGIQIKFSTPKHKPTIKSRKAILPESTYQLKDMPFRSTYNSEFDITDDWKSMCLFSHDWAFKGSWFSGCVANVHMSLMILKQKTPNESLSFFHPRAFEQTIGNFITNTYSKLKFEGQFEYIAPVNWQSIKNLTVIASRFKVIKNEAIAPYSNIEYLFLPIDDKHIMYFVFHPHRSASGSKADIDKQISDENMNTLINNIMNSLEITLSSNAQLQQEKALQGLTDTSLIEEFLPMDWRKLKKENFVEEKMLLNIKSK